MGTKTHEEAWSMFIREAERGKPQLPCLALRVIGHGGKVFASVLKGSKNYGSSRRRTNIFRI